MCFASSQLRALLYDGKDTTYTGGGNDVVETVDVAGTFRYELQKDVAGPPRIFRIANAPVTTLQLTARSSKPLAIGFATAVLIKKRTRMFVACILPQERY